MAFLTIILIASISAIFFYGPMYYATKTTYWIGIFILGIEVLSYLLTVIINPGLPDRTMRKFTAGPVDKKDSVDYCSICNVIKKAAILT